MAADQAQPTTYLQAFHGAAGDNKMLYRQLGKTALYTSYLGFGASSLGSVFRATDDHEACEVVKLAMKSGINYIDTAPWYGHGKSEKVLGNALKEIPREVYYIATKVGRYHPNPAEMFDFSYDRTMASVDESLERLGLSYVDLIQVHDIEFAPSLDIVVNETLLALQKIKEQGKARYIGVTGYSLSILKKVVEMSTVKIDTVLTYCRYSMNDTTFVDYKEFFESQGVGVINASPISMGLLTTRGPPEWHPAVTFAPNIVEACSQAAKYCQENGVDISRLALHFSLELPDCSTCLVSTASVKNMNRNLDVVLNPLTNKERQILSEVMEKYMRPLNNANWEGHEVAAVKKAALV